MISVTYPDLDDCTTVKLPMLAFADEYKMPAVGDEVIVLHMGNGSAMGFVLGKYWNKSKHSLKTGLNVYRKEFGHVPGQAYMEYEDGGNLVISANDIVFKTSAGTVSVNQIISWMASR